MREVNDDEKCTCTHPYTHIHTLNEISSLKYVQRIYTLLSTILRTSKTVVLRTNKTVVLGTICFIITFALCT